MGSESKEKQMMASWETALTKIEKESFKLLEKHVFGDGGKPRDNGIISRVNWHCQEALNALAGAKD